MSTAVAYDRSWRFLSDDDLRRALVVHRRSLLLVDDDNPHPEVRESTRQYLVMLIHDGEVEDARREYCAKLGVPRDAERFPADWLAALKANVQLDELLVYDGGAKLRKANRNGIRRGPCPFCRTSPDSTSFVVSIGDPLHQWYHCFACLTGGDCFSAIMQAWGLEFPQAVEKLARDSNFPPPATPPAPPTNPRRARLASLPGRMAH